MDFRPEDVQLLFEKVASFIDDKSQGKSEAKVVNDKVYLQHCDNLEALVGLDYESIVDLKSSISLVSLQLVYSIYQLESLGLIPHGCATPYRNQISKLFKSRRQSVQSLRVEFMRIINQVRMIGS